MSIFKKLFGGGDKKKKEDRLQNVIRDRDPESEWEIVSELGDGAFGKVYKVSKLSVLKWLVVCISGGVTKLCVGGTHWGG